MISTHRVDTKAFYEHFTTPEMWNARIEEAIRQLVERYDLRDMHILGIGSGVSQEEWWLWKHGGNRLTILDIDEHGRIGPVLQTLPPGDLTFHVGDAMEYFASARTERFDAIYVSGLTPDEVRRFEILWNGQRVTILKKLQARLFGRWPRGAAPFHPLLMEASRQLAPGGFLIVQSIGFGIDVLMHRHFLPAAQRQLSKHGMQLLEVHRWTRPAGVNLFVARANGGSPWEPGPPLTLFHGRGEPHQAAERVWPR